MTIYQVKVNEIKSNIIEVVADCEKHAIDKAEIYYHDKDIILPTENIEYETTFDLIPFNNLKKVYEIVRIKQEVTLNKKEVPYKIKSPDDIAEVAFNFIGNEDREIMFLICCSNKLEVIAVHRISIGTVNSAIVHPREIFKTAILNNASSIILVHNHPSINALKPSPEDIDVTRRIEQCGDFMGIELLDHLILNGERYTSMKAKGYM